MKLEGTVFTQNHPHFNTQCKLRLFSKPSLGSKLCWKDSENSVNAVIVVVLVITGKGYKLKSAKTRGT